MVGALSRRSMKAMKPLSSYFPAFAKAMERPWSPLDPEGNIVMVVAENRLLSERFLERLQRCAPPTRTEQLYYSDFRGTPPLREAVANFMTKHITQTHAVGAEHLALGNGAGTVLDNLFHCLADDGDGVMLPVPLYPTFLNDLQVRCGLRPTFVQTDAENGYFPTVQQLEAAADSAAADGRWGRYPRVLLLTNPTNPLGTVIDPAAYTEAIRWAVDRGMHVVSGKLRKSNYCGTPAAAAAARARNRRDIYYNIHTYVLDRNLMCLNVLGWRIAFV
eukprot:COSAG06_NODE_753_length_12547_cov_928.116244_3_plen_275_part_00